VRGRRRGELAEGQRIDRVGLVEPDVLVELRRQNRLEVVALQLGVGTVDDSDRPLEARLCQLVGELVASRIAERELERRHPGVVAQPLVAVRARRSHAHAFHRSVPVVGGCDDPVIGAESHDEHVVAERLAAQMADVVLATRGHLGRRGIADVRVMLPDDKLGISATVGEDRSQRIEHVLVAQVPGQRRSVVHRAVVAFRAGHNARVLGGIEELVAVLRSVVEALREQVAQHGGDVVLARLHTADERGAAVRRRIVLPGCESAVALARRLRRDRVDAIEVAHDLVGRGVHAVEVQARETDLALRLRCLDVVRA
jgi:hypothetical protein